MTTVGRRDSFRHRRVEAGDVLWHVAETGPEDGPAVVLLHGWPQDARCWAPVMTSLGDDFRVIAPDLPGIADSAAKVRDGRKRTIARQIAALLDTMGLDDVALVGHDVGGQVVFAALRELGDRLRAAAILSVAVPGIPPWNDVIRNPNIWHFAFHAIDDLPEQLVAGKQRAYFDWFFDAIAATPAAIDEHTRADAAEAYDAPSALTAGFDWYRAFATDSIENADRTGGQMTTPLLYARGEHEPGELDAYVEGLRRAGCTDITTAIIDGSGHFTPTEQPAALASVLRHHLARVAAAADRRA